MGGGGGRTREWQADCALLALLLEGLSRRTADVGEAQAHRRNRGAAGHGGDGAAAANAAREQRVERAQLVVEAERREALTPVPTEGRSA